MELKPCILDLETSIKNKEIGNNKASPFYPDNQIVLGMFKYSIPGVHSYTAYMNNDMTEEKKRDTVHHMLMHSNLLVGHNIKFDLLHLRQHYNQLYQDWVKRGGCVWDTQVVEYLLSGQSKLYPSLDYCAEKYGGTLKDEKIKEYWDEGIDTEDIPIAELIEYLEKDIENTELVFDKQAQIVDNRDMYALVTTQMDALLALVEMEFNGMAVDKVGIHKRYMKLLAVLDDLENQIERTMKKFFPDNMKQEISAASPKQISTVLFGGLCTVIEDQPVLTDKGTPYRYKSGMKKGEIKTKKAEKKVFVDGFKLPKDMKLIGKNGLHSTDDNVIVDIVRKKYGKNPEAELFASLLGMHRTVHKDIFTYYEGILKLIFPDGLVHPNFNQCATATGRLSSNNPNAQNISGKKDE